MGDENGMGAASSGGGWRGRCYGREDGRVDGCFHDNLFAMRDDLKETAGQTPDVAEEDRCAPHLRIFLDALLGQQL